MKKSIPFLFVCMLPFVSCQKPKDWSCSCECKPLGGNTTTETTTIKNKKMGEANTLCSDFGKAKVNGNGTWKCEIN